ncbi:MAG TPA: hypothetical protein VGC69_18085 [Bordetella sp.]
MSRTTLRASVAGLAMALASGAAIPVFAATAAAASPAAGEAAQPPQHPGHWQHGAKGRKPHGGMPMMMWREGLMIPGLGPISKPQVEALKLDANQQALLKQARDAQGDLFKARREAMVKQRGLIDQQTTAGKLDPRALASAADANRDQFRGQATQLRDKWLAVWDSLNDTQRTQVAGFVKEREARMNDMHERMEHKGHSKQQGPAAG